MFCALMPPNRAATRLTTRSASAVDDARRLQHADVEVERVRETLPVGERHDVVPVAGQRLLVVVDPLHREGLRAERELDPDAVTHLVALVGRDVLVDEHPSVGELRRDRRRAARRRRSSSRSRADAPVTGCDVPLICTVPNRYSTTVEPGSSFLTALAASGLNGWKFFGERMKSACVWSSIELAKDSLADAPKMAMKLTSARPIMSAAAVDAVRRGFRIAFCCARIPVMLCARSAGHVRAFAAGRAKSGLSIATPMNTRNAAAPVRIAGAPLGGIAEEPEHERAEPGDREHHAPDVAPASGADVERLVAQRGDRRDSCGAAGRRQRRHEGHERSHQQRDDDRARQHLQRAGGEVDAERAQQRFERLHDGEAEQPGRRRTRRVRPPGPRTRPMPPPDGRVAPSDRSRPSSRSRCATVIEKVL